MWGVLIFYIAWRRSHRNQPGAPGVARSKVPYGRAGVPTLALQMAVVVITIIPVLFVYPFVQKHFAKGVLLGAIKG